MMRGADGRTIYVITTEGGYRYLGRLVVDFDAAGEIVQIVSLDSGPIRVSGNPDDSDLVTGDATLEASVVAPVTEYVATLASNVLGTTQVALDGVRANVRTRETNLGNLVADAFLWQGSTLASAFGVDAPNVALANGGGIRNNSTIPVGDFSELDTFSILPFANFISVVEDVPVAQLQELLENAVSRVELSDGRFAQVSGLAFTWDDAGTAQLVDADGNVTTPGTRVVDIDLVDATGLVTPLVVAGVAVDPMATVDVAIADFLAKGGDSYPFRGAQRTALTTLGITYQQALYNFVSAAPASGGLGGTITGTDYPEVGGARITRL